MKGYLLRRIAYAIPILIGVNLLTFILFFSVNSPEDMARMHLGQKHITEEDVRDWKRTHGYDYPNFLNTEAEGIEMVIQTLFFQKSMKLFLFDFGVSDNGRDISYDITHRMIPSLVVALPIFCLGLAANILFSIFMVYFRMSRVDLISRFICITLMSISSLFYVIGGQYLLSIVFHWVPISGYEDGLDGIIFILLPILVGIIGGLGGGSRWYRIIFMEEMSKEYVRTARAKGLSDWQVITHHVLKNGLIPILTGIVVVIPTLFMGSLILESFFGIPGLGSYTIDAINQQDFAIVRCMVFLGSFLYIIGLVLTDIAYVWVDPRVRFT